MSTPTTTMTITDPAGRTHWPHVADQMGMCQDCGDMFLGPSVARVCWPCLPTGYKETWCEIGELSPEPPPGGAAMNLTYTKLLRRFLGMLYHPEAERVFSLESYMRLAKMVDMLSARAGKTRRQVHDMLPAAVADLRVDYSWVRDDYVFSPAGHEVFPHPVRELEEGAYL